MSFQYYLNWSKSIYFRNLFQEKIFSNFQIIYTIFLIKYINFFTEHLYQIKKEIEIPIMCIF